jgi:hypothetical protein
MGVACRVALAPWSLVTFCVGLRWSQPRLADGSPGEPSQPRGAGRSFIPCAQPVAKRRFWINQAELRSTLHRHGCTLKPRVPGSRFTTSRSQPSSFCRHQSLTCGVVVSDT